MIFIDSNIPMYLVGASHAHKVNAQHALERAIAERRRLVTDAEVLQEILHRYRAIDRLEAIQPAFDAILGVVDEVLPIEQQDVQKAKDLLFGLPKLSSRDALHIAVMERQGIREIMTFDQGFDQAPGITRVS